MDRIDLTCPCDVQYRISATVYSAEMKPLHVINDVKPRLDHRYTFVDIPGMVNNTCYIIYSYICIAQGTLGRDDCSPATIDEHCTSFPVDAFPPPSQPPAPPPPGQSAPTSSPSATPSATPSTSSVPLTSSSPTAMPSSAPSVASRDHFQGNYGITTEAAGPPYHSSQPDGKVWDPFYPPGREGQCPPPLNRGGLDYKGGGAQSNSLVQGTALSCG